MAMEKGSWPDEQAADQIRSKGKHRTLGHSTSGPCLLQNLVCILEGEKS